MSVLFSHRQLRLLLRRPIPHSCPAAQVFVIKIRLGTFAWTVYRRFSQFRALGEQVCFASCVVRAAFCLACLTGPFTPVQLRRKVFDSPPCPPKRVLSAHTPEFLEHRRLELLDWVRAVSFCLFPFASHAYAKPHEHHARCSWHETSGYVEALNFMSFCGLKLTRPLLVWWMLLSPPLLSSPRQHPRRRPR